jgi:hypothetical protein
MELVDCLDEAGLDVSGEDECPWEEDMALYIDERPLYISGAWLIFSATLFYRLLAAAVNDTGQTDRLDDKHQRRGMATFTERVGTQNSIVTLVDVGQLTERPTLVRP